MPAPHRDSIADRAIQKSYVRVLIVWIVTLIALYAFQELFL